MRILLTNDDGIHAEGIKTLAMRLYEAGHDVFICAPSENNSCVSHGLTLREPLYADKTVLEGLEELTSYSVSGTPTDCVRLAVGNLGADPELILSGINHAPNLGTDAVYSGTVSAALEGYMIHIPSIAVSKDTFELDHMDDAAAFFVRILPELMSFFDRRPGMLNVNIPSASESDYKGIRVAPTVLQEYLLKYEESTDASGKTLYSVSSVKLTRCEEEDETDENMMRKGFVVVTPLTYDITDHREIGRAKNMFERDF